MHIHTYNKERNEKSYKETAHKTYSFLGPS